MPHAMYVEPYKAPRVEVIHFFPWLSLKTGNQRGKAPGYFCQLRKHGSIYSGLRPKTPLLPGLRISTLSVSSSTLQKFFNIMLRPGSYMRKVRQLLPE